MTKKELIELLEPYPDDIAIWVRQPYEIEEEAFPFVSLTCDYACDANLYLSEVSDEYSVTKKIEEKINNLGEEDKKKYEAVIRDGQTILTKKVLIIE